MRRNMKKAAQGERTKTAINGGANGKAIGTAQATLAERRRKFVSKLLPKSVAIIVSNSEKARSNDSEYPYRQASDVLYLSNFPEPQSILILSNLAGQTKFTILVRPKDKTSEIWTGKRIGSEAAKKQYAADHSATYDQFPTLLKELLAKAENVYYKFGNNEHFDQQFKEAWLNTAKPLFNPEITLHEMRLIKSKEEIALMQHAAEISAKGHCIAMQKSKPGLMEYQLQAEIEQTFLFNGARSPAYTSIVAGGANAVTLHYIENKDILNDGDLVLIDAAGEYQGYASDVTRTFPVNGKFTKPQKEIYQLVLAAQLAAIDAARPGTTLAKIHDKTRDVLRRGLIELGILSKNLASQESEAKLMAKAKKTGKKLDQLVLFDLFMHGTSHWLGLDVHDIGTLGTRSGKGKNLPLQPGMTFTVEPGLYFDPQDVRVPKRYRGIGVRIEDDVVITKSGCHVLSKGVPKAVEEIEALMSRR